MVKIFAYAVAPFPAGNGSKQWPETRHKKDAPLCPEKWPKGAVNKISANNNEKSGKIKKASKRQRNKSSPKGRSAPH